MATIDCKPKSKEQSYQPRRIKRNRRTKAAINSLRQSLYELASEFQPLTVRQLFYRAVAVGLIDKSQKSYSQDIVRLVGLMREEGQLPFDWIVDNTRWMRKPRTYSSLHSMLHYSQRTYRRAIWDDQKAYIEIWCESDSIAGVLGSVTDEYDVPLMPCSGQPSKSFLHSAAENIATQEKPCHLYYFGDYDKAGMDISKRIHRDFERYLPSRCVWTFERVALNEAQILEFNLPTRPPKDARGGFTQTVELEAMTTQQLHSLCRHCIEQHIDECSLQRTRQVEELERETLATIASQIGGGE